MRSCRHRSDARATRADASSRPRRDRPSPRERTARKTGYDSDSGERESIAHLLLDADGVDGGVYVLDGGGYAITVDDDVFDGAGATCDRPVIFVGPNCSLVSLF